jgi:hypothetical protein
MEQSGYYRKYIILEELDSGFGVQRTPEGFARLEGNREGITLFLQIKNLRGGISPYTVILIYNSEKDLEVFRIGSLDVYNGTGVMRRSLDNAAMQAVGIKPESIDYIIIASEHRERIFIPLIGICSKAKPWDEVVRHRLLKKGKAPAAEHEKTKISPMRKTEPSQDSSGKEAVVDASKLEKKLKESFESFEPFSNPRHDYSWYRVNDIAKLSNLLFICNMKIPLFANPKILVGLFKYRHILAGIYRSAHNDMNYFVLGVPQRTNRRENHLKTSAAGWRAKVKSTVT